MKYKLISDNGEVHFPCRKVVIENVEYYVSEAPVTELKLNQLYLINKVLCKTELRDGEIVSRQLTGGGTMDICKTECELIVIGFYLGEY